MLLGRIISYFWDIALPARSPETLYAKITFSVDTWNQKCTGNNPRTIGQLKEQIRDTIRAPDKSLLRKIKINFLSRLQEYIAWQRENLQDAVFKKHVLDGILLLIPNSIVSHIQINLTKQRSENRHILLGHLVLSLHLPLKVYPFKRDHNKEFLAL